MLRVLVVADDPLGRERLAALVAEDPDCAVVGPADPDEAVLLSRDADIALWAQAVNAGSAWRGAFEESGLPVVVLGRPGRAAEAIASGARGYLTWDVDAPVLGAALRAAAAGLQVIDPARGDTPADDTPPMEELTPREREVLQWLAEGLSNREIAGRLRISEHTVKFHVNTILGKLGARTRTEAVTRAARQGLIIL